MTGLLRVPVISLRLYTKWSKIVKTGGKLESQGFSFFTVVKISTTLKKLPFTDGIDSVVTLFGYDTKANLQQQSELVDIWIPVRTRDKLQD